MVWDPPACACCGTARIVMTGEDVTEALDVISPQRQVIKPAVPHGMSQEFHLSGLQEDQSGDEVQTTFQWKTFVTNRSAPPDLKRLGPAEPDGHEDLRKARHAPTPEVSG